MEEELLEMVSSIVISKEKMNLLLEESKKSEKEFGALLFGRIEGNKAIVHLIKLLRYSERSTTHFIADPIFLLESFSEAEKMGLELVGIFHSHPAPPKPSASDLRYMALNPVVWLIVDNTNFTVGAYVLEKGGLRQVGIEVIKNFS
ncbi:MAG: metalloprotease [Thermoproteota archaeon]|nr:MAG: metalloprotease [Candidatus Korarchaeota archaeon]RLG49237.1 MAG: metalloprotease [Candidatus Korarchaeota archaeon]